MGCSFSSSSSEAMTLGRVRVGLMNGKLYLSDLLTKTVGNSNHSLKLQETYSIAISALGNCRSIIAPVDAVPKKGARISKVDGSWKNSGFVSG